LICIGHRGAKGYVAENTLKSIQKAIQLGAHGVEIDVHAVDNRLLVIHDETLDRTTNGVGRLSMYSFEELRNLDAGCGERIPTLEEVISFTQGKICLNIELKGVDTARGVVSQLNTLRKSHREHIVVSSFLVSELALVESLNKTIKLGVLVGPNISKSFEIAVKLKAYSVHLSKKEVTREFVNKAHAENLKIFVYTINEVSNIRQMKALGVDGVFSDYPDRVLNCSYG
jgi:glycerophosphoryl diester phosphodiesterase